LAGNSSQNRNAPELIDGTDALPRLAERLHELGARRVLVISAPGRRHVDTVLAALVRFDTEVFDGAQVHVPGEVVDRAAAALGGADTMVTVGGGSATGLGKALRLDHELRFAAVPTTYSASEMTSIHGVTRDGRKVTGRADRVRPDLVAYDPALTATLPIGLTVQSLLNALAHPVGALSTASLEGDDRAAALDCAAALVRAIEDLLLWPSDLRARRRALIAASRAGALLDRGKMGVHHALAHLLGGGLGLPHAPLHSVLLPQTLAHLRSEQPALMAELETAVGRPALEAHLHDLLTRAGAARSLDALDADAGAVAELARSRPELPAEVVADAQHGLRPTGSGQRLPLGPEPMALLAGPDPSRARRVVVALHGRGAEAGGMVRRVRELAGNDPTTAIIGLRSGDNRWYATRYGAPGAGDDAEVTAALARVDQALASLAAVVPPASTVLAGFSQGACLALEFVARNPGRVAAVVAPCGARIGAPSAWNPAAPGSHAGLRALLGAAAQDHWVDAAHVDATARWLRDAGAAVDLAGSPGDRHDIAAQLRLRARDIILNRPEPSGATGFGNAITSEALAGAVPRQQNTPRLSPHGLYPEQINGTGFTAARADNLRTWCYRIRPSSQRRSFAPLAHATFGAAFEGRPPAIDLTGFAPPAAPTAPADFVDGLVTMGGAGSPSLRRGWAVHLYACDRNMEDRAFYDADGDLLLIPQEGALTVITELGPLEVSPGQLAILPRGIAFSVQLHGARARGWLAEIYGRHFRLPERGLVGANGLADERHFRAPAAWYEDRLAPGFRITASLGGGLHETTQDHSPFDVVGWHGNYSPWVYDFDDFAPSANVRFDHGDPSIFTVLTTPLDEIGAHLLNLILFPTRWDATHGTFRPPFFHRNAVFEFNGIVHQAARDDSPFVPGVSFFTPPMTAHGVSGRTVERLRALSDDAADRTMRLGAPSLWFQLESSLPMSLTPWAEAHRLPNWGATWASHASFFDPEA